MTSGDDEIVTSTADSYTVYDAQPTALVMADFTLILGMYGHYNSKAWINRVRLPILLVVS